MARPRRNAAPPRRPKTVLQEIFVKRVLQEMQLQGLNANALAKRVGAPPQRTLHEVLNFEADPRLNTVSAIATALGKSPHELLRESSPPLSPSGNTIHFPAYPRILQQPAQAKYKTNSRDKRSGGR